MAAPDDLVVHTADARWLGAAETGNTSPIGILPQIPSKTMWFGLQDIDAGSASVMHRHAHEAVHYVLSGSGYSEIGGERRDWSAGDFVYTPPNVWHRHYSAADEAVRMIVVQNSGLLEFLGVDHRAESAGQVTYAELLAAAAHDD